jgi:hypothetical protein
MPFFRRGIDLLDQFLGRVMFSCIRTEQSQWAQPFLALSIIEHRMPILSAKRDALHKAVCPHSPSMYSRGSLG